MISNSKRYEEEQLNFPQADFPFSALVAEKDEDEEQYGWRYEDLVPRQPLMFPPRLRLQSRPVLQGQEGGEADELASSSMKAFLVTEERRIAQRANQRQRHEEPERKSMLARVVRWFVTPFAASSEQERQVEEQRWRAQREPQDERSNRVMYPPAVSLPQKAGQGSLKLVRRDAVQEETDTYQGRKEEAVPQTKLPVDFPEQEAVGLSHMGRRKNRLAGRTTKIRLETVSRPALQVVPKTYEPDSQQEPEEYQTGERMGFLDAEDWTSMRLPAYRKKDMTSDRLAAVDIYEGRANAAMRRTLAGSGRLESGQSDVTIANEHITAASIVVVTLTSNPGPVVVHYVSLQPSIGFTVHLTAPATVSTTFNYVILLGELF